jgi:hypothetical protein
MQYEALPFTEERQIPSVVSSALADTEAEERRVVVPGKSPDLPIRPAEELPRILILFVLCSQRTGLLALGTECRRLPRILTGR